MLVILGDVLVPAVDRRVRRDLGDQAGGHQWGQQVDVAGVVGAEDQRQRH